MGSFCCFIPGSPVVSADAFQQVDQNRWVCHLQQETPINELAAFVTKPLAPGTALGCHVAAAPFERWHYLGSLTSAAPSAVFKTRYVWSNSDAVPTHIQFGVSLESESSLAQQPAERVSAEVIAVATRIGKDLYDFCSSFATDVNIMGERRIQLPANIFERWLKRFQDRCKQSGLDWLSQPG